MSLHYSIFRSSLLFNLVANLQLVRDLGDSCEIPLLLILLSTDLLCNSAEDLRQVLPKLLNCCWYTGNAPLKLWGSRLS
jgi:hypothetical protein